LLGTGMAVTLTLSDIPAGVWSDAFSRKWPLVVGHGFLAAGMLLTGLVTAFPLLPARARWDLVGGMAGMIVFGVLGWAISLAVAIVASGAGQRRGHHQLAVPPAAGGAGFPA
jgi:MFS transporter, DHA3 family, tetracycline resistance protein